MNKSATWLASPLLLSSNVRTFYSILVYKMSLYLGPEWYELAAKSRQVTPFTPVHGGRLVDVICGTAVHVFFGYGFYSNVTLFLAFFLMVTSC